jgi:hypothetical protein
MHPHFPLPKPHDLGRRGGRLSNRQARRLRWDAPGGPEQRGGPAQPVAARRGGPLRAATRTHRWPIATNHSEEPVVAAEEPLSGFCDPIVE